MAHDPKSPRAGAGGREAGWRQWALSIAVVLLLIIAVQNSQEVDFDILFFVSTSAPLFVLLLITAALGAVIGYVAPLIRRHRRQERDG